MLSWTRDGGGCASGASFVQVVCHGVWGRRGEGRRSGERGEPSSERRRPLRGQVCHLPWCGRHSEAGLRAERGTQHESPRVAEGENGRPGAPVDPRGEGGNDDEPLQGKAFGGGDRVPRRLHPLLRPCQVATPMRRPAMRQHRTAKAARGRRSEVKPDEAANSGAKLDPDAAAAPGSGVFGLSTAPAASRFVVVPVPFEATTSYGGGGGGGPGPALRPRQHGRRDARCTCGASEAGAS